MDADKDKRIEQLEDELKSLWSDYKSLEKENDELKDQLKDAVSVLVEIYELTKKL